MNHEKIHIVLKSIRHYRKQALQEFVIILLLSSVISGSLLTGFSVRQSLKSSAARKLGETGLLISSGIRYLDPELEKKLTKITGTDCSGILESEGFAQNFITGKQSFRAKVIGITRNFFAFNGFKSVDLKPGEVAINSNLAARLELSAGDELILKLTTLSDVPASSPFAPASEPTNSRVFKVAKIITGSEGGDFSLGISQITPDNIFINLDDEAIKGKVNRILISNRSRKNETDITGDLDKVLSPEDIGLTVRKVPKTGECEIISSRIFMDQEMIDEIKSAIPAAYPVITYLANSLTLGSKSAPYSFIAALDSIEYPEIPENRGIVISDWLADDIKAIKGDTIIMTWYAPGRIRELLEKKERFVISAVEGRKGIWADSLLMPEFPGIAGKASCTNWDAGVEIKMDRIRKKDEDYWNRYRGTPKAFINYAVGKELWGNNFGPATALRFPSSYKTDNVLALLKGKLKPSGAGITVTNIRLDMINAAEKSVDFGTLFLSLGFFIFVSCIIILILAVSSAFDSRKEQVTTFVSLGFRDRLIRQLMFLETGSIALVGSLAGILSGLIINFIMIHALNSVWIGAVQTSNLNIYPGAVPMITGFCVSFFLALISLYFEIRGFLRKSLRAVKVNPIPASGRINRYILSILITISCLLIITGITGLVSPVISSFISGSAIFITLIFLWRQLVLSGFTFRQRANAGFNIASAKYYKFHPAKATMPVILIAAGLFAVVITGVNRLRISEQSLSASGGTGGYQLWAETTIPVMEDLNSLKGRIFHGLDGVIPSDAVFVQAKRTSGDDASCLNLNFVATPPLLGIDPADFEKNHAFSFSSLLKNADRSDPWSMLNKKPDHNTFYGFADQTVLQWALKKQAGDTLKFRSESGVLISIVIAGGLKSSIFQGYLLVGEDNFTQFYPSVSGNTVLLFRSSEKATDPVRQLLSDRFENYGITVQSSAERLSSFFRVTNTYLSVFTMLGGFGMILGVVGLGFVLNRNYTSRKKEFALMIASGFKVRYIKWIILREQILILIAGIITGVTSGLVASSSSAGNFEDIPWISLAAITLAVAFTGVISLLVSVKGISHDSLVTVLRRE